MILSRECKAIAVDVILSRECKATAVDVILSRECKATAGHCSRCDIVKGM